MARSKEVLAGGIRTSDLVSLGVLAQRISASEVKAAVADSGRQSVRRRSLPAEMVVLLCMALWLFRDVSYEDTLDCLIEAWRWLGLPGGDGATKGAISQARTRLGPEPMKILFERLAVPLATQDTKGAWYKGRRIVTMDATLFETPDTTDNGKAFGYPSGAHGRGPFPRVRVMALSEASTHACFACAIGSYTTSESKLCRQFIGALTPNMILLADRNFFGAKAWEQFDAAGAALLWRIQSNAPVKLVQRLADGSYLGKLTNTKSDFPVRIIIYRLEGSEETVRLATNILDPDQAPAIELARLYPERWEAELVFDEIKSHISESRLALRSKKPELVEQEIWGLMLLHWALRDLMHEAAQAHARDPDTISFVKTIRLVKLQMAKDGSFSP